MIINDTGIFPENIFRYQNDHSNTFGGGHFSPIKGPFNYFMFTLGHFHCGNGPIDTWFKGPFQILGG